MTLVHHCGVYYRKPGYGLTLLAAMSNGVQNATTRVLAVGKTPASRLLSRSRREKAVKRKSERLD